MSVEKEKKPPRKLDEIAPFLARDLTSRNVVALVLDRTGKVLANGKRLPEEPKSAPLVLRYVKMALGGMNEVTYTIHRQGVPFIVLLIPLRSSPSNGKIVGVVQLTASLASVRETLFRHGIILAFIVFSVLLVGAVLGRLLVSSSLKDLKQMVVTCRAISEGDLNRQVTLPKRGGEIGQLSEAFDGMVTRIRKTMEAQRRFVANAAHELRTPVAGLRGSVEVLMRGVQDDPAASARLIQGMYREIARLSSLCERLLDLNRLDGIMNIHKQSIDLVDFFRDLFPQLEKLVQGRILELNAGLRVSILFDPDMLRQVLFNLVQNSLQHTQPGGRIVLGWRLMAEPQGVMIWVEDNGEGIPSEDLPHVFEPFYRGSNKSRKPTDGTGLGLSIARSIAKAHGSEISIESTPGMGTKVILRIPFE